MRYGWSHLLLIAVFASLLAMTPLCAQETNEQNRRFLVSTQIENAYLLYLNRSGKSDLGQEGWINAVLEKKLSLNQAIEGIANSPEADKVREGKKVASDKLPTPKEEKALAIELFHAQHGVESLLHAVGAASGRAFVDWEITVKAGEIATRYLPKSALKVGSATLNILKKLGPAAIVLTGFGVTNDSLENARATLDKKKAKEDFDRAVERLSVSLAVSGKQLTFEGQNISRSELIERYKVLGNALASSGPGVGKKVWNVVKSNFIPFMHNDAAKEDIALAMLLRLAAVEMDLLSEEIQKVAIAKWSKDAIHHQWKEILASGKTIVEFVCLSSYRWDETTKHWEYAYEVEKDANGKVIGPKTRRLELDRDFSALGETSYNKTMANVLTHLAEGANSPFKSLDRYDGTVDLSAVRIQLYKNEARGERIEQTKNWQNLLKECAQSSDFIQRDLSDTTGVKSKGNAYHHVANALMIYKTYDSIGGISNSLGMTPERREEIQKAIMRFKYTEDDLFLERSFHQRREQPSIGPRSH